MLKSFSKLIVAVLVFPGFLFAASDQLLDTTNLKARDIVKTAIDNYRGTTSYLEGSMTIHRRDWERTIKMISWTQGLDRSLIRITAPKKDKGAGTLLIKDDMWSYAPKINRVIKIPSSMSNQNWMGSDFSNNDIARADDIIDQYDHKIIGSEKINGVLIYTIQSTPHDDAPVVWGKEIITINEHYVLLKHEFYDQDNRIVKTLISDNITIIDERHVALHQRMQKIDNPGEWTEFSVSQIKFNLPIKSNTFTLSTLRNPR